MLYKIKIEFYLFNGDKWNLESCKIYFDIYC